MKRQLTLISLMCFVLMANALDIRQQNINRIKKSKAFLYSDVTMATKEDAASLAYEQMQQEIMNWASERSKKKIGSISATEINKLVDTIMVRRAEMYRVVAYVKKAKLVSAFKEWKLVLDPVKDIDSHDDTNDIPIDSSPKDTLEQTVPPQSKQEKTDSLIVQLKDSVINGDIINILKQNYLGRKGGVIEQIKKARNFFELKKIMEPMKERGEITYGKYATAEKPEECYLIVYDPAGNIKALLGKGEKVRQNLKTGKNDGIQNYRGCGAIWFKITDNK